MALVPKQGLGKRVWELQVKGLGHWGLKGVKGLGLKDYRGYNTKGFKESG